MVLPLTISPGDPGHIGDHEEIDVFLAAIGSPFVVGQIAMGTFASRPAAGTADRFYWATDRKVLYLDDGAAWNALNIDGSQTQVLTDGSSFSLSSTQAAAYTKTATLPSTWVSMDIEVSGFITDQYGNDSGFRRALAQVKVDGTAPAYPSNTFWEDIAASSVNRSHDLILKNAGTAKTGSVTLSVENWLNHPGASGTPGTDHVSAINLYLEVLKHRRS